MGQYSGPMFGSPGGGGIETFANIAARDASTGHVEGDTCYVTDVRTRYRYLESRGGLALGYWIEGWIYERGGALNPLENAAGDPVRWASTNSGRGTDDASTVPADPSTQRGWSVLADQGIFPWPWTSNAPTDDGDAVFTGVTGNAGSQLYFNSINNWPTTGGLIFLMMEVDCTTAGPSGSTYAMRTSFFTLYDYGYVYFITHNRMGTKNDAMFFRDFDGYQIHGLCRHSAFQMVHAVMRVGAGGTGYRPDRHTMWKPADGYYQEANEAVARQSQYSIATSYPRIYMGSRGGASWGGQMKVRSFYAFTMEE